MILRHSPFCQMLARHVRFTSTVRAFHNLRGYQEDVRWPGWQIVIGIETHAQIKSRQKLFSESLTSKLNDAPNTHVSLFDAAFPGTLPKINPKCVDLALRTALALKCNISRSSSFDRKHYFYSDLPAGYQITQHYSPLARNGELEIHSSALAPIKIRIKQIQLEQDTAKSTFSPRSFISHINLNRAGTGLMEIVSEPDLRSPEEAGAYVRTLQAVLRSVGSSDGNMEQGSLRCDVNVSLNKLGDPPGIRCEIKNLNSVKFMMAAIIYEIHRQKDFLHANPGATVPQETRGFKEDTFETFRLRSKEDAPDYRYMPDPNLGTLVLSQTRIEEIQQALPLLPWQRRAHLLEKYPTLGKKEKSLDVLLKLDNGRDIGFDGEDTGGAIGYFEKLCQRVGNDGAVFKRDPILVLNWLTHDLLGHLSEHGLSFISNPITSEQFGEMLDLIIEKRITGTSARYLLRYMLTHPSPLSPTEIAIQQQFMATPSDATSSATTSSASPPTDLQSLCEVAISALPREVQALRSGASRGVLNKIVGYVMKRSKGRADAIAVRKLLEKMIFWKENP